MKNIGKPCAGKPHARFDEGGQARACSLLYPFSSFEALAMSSITFAELVYGARKSLAVANNMERLLALRSRIRVLLFDDGAVMAA